MTSVHGFSDFSALNLNLATMGTNDTNLGSFPKPKLSDDQSSYHASLSFKSSNYNRLSVKPVGVTLDKHTFLMKT